MPVRGQVMRRRSFLTLLGSAVTWPLASRAQQPARMRRVAVLMHTAADDPDGQTRLAAFLQGLQEAGWAVGGNVRVDIRWAAADADRFRSYTAELIGLAPDVVLASSSQSVVAFQKATSTLPIVFAAVVDPVAQGFVDNIARPGGNITGFAMVPEFSTSAKWLELLKQIAPTVTRVAVIRDTAAQTSLMQFSAIQSMAQSIGVVVNPIGMRDVSELERAITAFAQTPNGGLIATAVPQLFVRRAVIISLAARSGCLLYFRFVSSLLRVAWPLTEPIRPTPIGALPATSIASSRARRQPTCRCRRRPSTSS